MAISQPEIIICGGSLAGLSAAIRLKQLGHDPLVLEKAKFPRAKLCGEFLGPDAFPVLERLGLLDTVLEAAFGRVENAIFYNRQAREIKVPMAWISRKHPYAVAVPREQLDLLMLWYARDLSVQVLEQARVEPLVSQVGDFMMIQAHQQAHQEDERVVPYQTKILVDATGRNSGLRLENGPKPRTVRPLKTLGLQCHIRCETVQDLDLRMYFFPGGYGGLQPISPGIANLCMLLNDIPAGLRKTEFQTVLRQTFSLNPTAREDLQNAEPMGPFNTTANLNLVAGKSELLQIGDARLTVDPFTGSGMAQALETGYMAAEAIHAGLWEKRTYPEIRRQYEWLYTRKFALRLKTLQLFRPLLFSGAAQDLAWPALRMLSPPLAALFR